jgi:hypothetical protein
MTFHLLTFCVSTDETHLMKKKLALQRLQKIAGEVSLPEF